MLRFIRRHGAQEACCRKSGFFAPERQIRKQIWMRHPGGDFEIERMTVGAWAPEPPL
jgi:hypothetical protein